MKKAIVIGSIVALVGGGAYLFYKKQIEQLQNMKYAFLKVSLISFSGTSAVVDVSIMVTSSSTLEAEITELNLDVYINGIKMGTVNEVKPIIIPAKGSSVVDLKVSFSPLGIGQNVLSLAADFWKSKDAVVTLNGYGKVKSAFIKTSVPFTYDTTLKEIMHT